MSKIKKSYHNEIIGRNDYGFPQTESQPDIDKGVWFEDANSGHWFRNLSDSDDISAVRVNGVEFRKPEFWWSSLNGDEQAQAQFMESLSDKKMPF